MLLLPNSDQSIAIYCSAEGNSLHKQQILSSGGTSLSWELLTVEEGPPVLWCPREQPEDGFPSVLYTQWEARQHDKISWHSDLKETNCIILYHLENPLSAEDRPHSQESIYTCLNLSGLLCFLIKTWLLSCFSGSLSPNSDLQSQINSLKISFSKIICWQKF